MFFFNYFRVISCYLKVFEKLNLFLHSVCKFYNKCLFLRFPLSWILSFSFQPKCENKLGQCEAGNSWINAHMGKSALLILSEMRETWDHHREKPPTVLRKQEVIWSSAQPSIFVLPPKLPNSDYQHEPAGWPEELQLDLMSHLFAYLIGVFGVFLSDTAFGVWFVK